jgi:ComF family protein
LSLLDILFPPRCAGCARRGAWLCATCVAALPRLPERRCRRCSDVCDDDICAACLRQPPPFDSLRCGFVYAGLAREAIHRLKYNGERQLAPVLVSAMVNAEPGLPRGDLLAPIPLHPARLRRRGYNQAELIARALGQSLRVATADRALHRLRDTASQVTVPAQQRWSNVRDAFAAEPSVVSGKHVILVDDVATTTSTLRAAALTLRDAGAAHVDAIVLVRALTSDPPRRGTLVAPDAH